VLGGLGLEASGSLGLVSRGVKKGLRFWTVVWVLGCFEGSEGCKYGVFRVWRDGSV